MSRYDFKSIRPVPSSTEFVDIVLSRTQRKTPTVIHQGYAIGRIRSFYMRKVKYTQETFSEKLSWILDDFPKLDDQHPFYGDLCNVLYDRDHYKLALGQLNVARNLISTISNDYVRLLKYGDTLYRCKQLKRAALGRMCTLMKKHKSSLGYLEEVRKHLSRLPSIDPNTRTLLITGYPNVGKSSFMNKVTRADVEVQPYAFTTKSLYVGHMDYKYLRWQVLDTPGILDKPLEERNTIEMQAITALAHLQCCVLYFVDLSEQCGWTLEQQCALFDNIRPLFANKPLVIVANKIDLVPLDSLSAAHQAMLDDIVKRSGATLLPMSAAHEINIAEVKAKACEMLLERRVELKTKSKKASAILSRLTVAVPEARDGKARPAFIPELVQEARRRKLLRAAKAKANGEAGDMDVDEDADADADADASGKPKRVLERDLERANGGPGIYSVDYKKWYKLRKDEFAYDVIPEIVDGKNIADFVDPDIMAKLEELEKEEEELAERENQELLAYDNADSDLDEEEKDIVARIRRKRVVVKRQHREGRGKNRTNIAKKHVVVPKGDFQQALAGTGHDASKVDPPVARRGRKREREGEILRGEGSLGPGSRAADEAEERTRSRSLSRSESRMRTLERSRSRSTTRAIGLGTVARVVDSNKRMKKDQKRLGFLGKAGTADRVVLTKMPKHLFAGKRGNGKTDRR